MDRALKADAWLEPGMNQWPADIPEPHGEEDLEAFITLFERWGFVRCEDASLESGYLKIAIYETEGSFWHVAKQLPSGRWSSKLGRSFDVRHDKLEELYESPLLGRSTPNVFMRRPFDGTDRFYVEDPYVIMP
jgi:hypothetical protein